MLPEEKLKTCLEVEDVFKWCNFTTGKDVVKVAMVLFIEAAMVGKDKKIQFDVDTLGIVDD